MSMEEGIAESLRLKLGDTLTYDIAGTPVTAPITSLRKVDWDSFRPNFFALFPPGVLETMPATYLGAVRVPEGPDSGALAVGAGAASIPNVLAIDVGEIMRQVQSIMDQVARAVEFVFLFTLPAGCWCCRRRSPRRRTSAASTPRSCARWARRSAQLAAAQIAEFLVLGALAGLLAAAGATAVGYVLADRVFQIPFAPTRWCGSTASSAARSR